MRRSNSYVLGHEETSRCKDGTPEKQRYAHWFLLHFEDLPHTLLKIHLTNKSSIRAYNNVCFTIACQQ